MEEYFKYIFEEKIYIHHVMELFAALAGSVYLWKTKNPIKNSRWFVIFLYSVLILDIMGGYTGIAYFSNYEILSFIKDTPFESNDWYYNIALVYFYICYLFFIRSQIHSPGLRKIVRWSMLVYLIIAVINFALSNDLFEKYIISNVMLGAFLNILAVLFYFYDMLMSEKLLYFYRNLFFYVSLGIAIQILVTVPIYIYHDFVNQSNPYFISVFRSVLLYVNILMYLMFALGFYMDYRYRNAILKVSKL